MGENGAGFSVGAKSIPVEYVFFTSFDSSPNQKPLPSTPMWDVMIEAEAFPYPAALPR